MRNHDQSIPDRSRPGLPTTPSGAAQQGTCENYATAKHSKNKRRKASEKAAGNVERETLTRKRAYLKYWNNNWKGKRAGRLDGTKECRYANRKQSGKGVKQGTLEVDANYFTTELMEEKMG